MNLCSFLMTGSRAAKLKHQWQSDQPLPISGGGTMAAWGSPEDEAPKAIGKMHSSGEAFPREGWGAFPGSPGIIPHDELPSGRNAT